MGKLTTIIVIGLPLVVFLAAIAWYSAATNVATPKYRLVKAEDAFEIRDYPSLRVAQVSKVGERLEAVRAGFRPLARYIFAKERDGEKIAMTAPVTQHKKHDRWIIQFIMPDKFSLADLPLPTDAQVSLREIPPLRRAAIRFSGVADTDLLSQKENLLRKWLQANDIVPIGEPIFAYYNDPLTPGFLRRNEVILTIGAQ